MTDYNNSTAQQNNLVELTGLWENTAKDKSTYLKGSMGQATMLVFANKQKREGTKDPDYKAYLCRKPKSKNKPADVDTSEF